MLTPPDKKHPSLDIELLGLRTCNQAMEKFVDETVWEEEKDKNYYKEYSRIEKSLNEVEKRFREEKRWQKTGGKEK